MTFPPPTQVVAKVSDMSSYFVGMLVKIKL